VAQPGQRRDRFTDSAQHQQPGRLQSGTYTFRATLNGCTSAPATTSVIINQAPTAVTVTPSAPDAFCAGWQRGTDGERWNAGRSSHGTDRCDPCGRQYHHRSAEPLWRQFENKRTQYMERASELTAAGVSGNITSVAFTVTGTLPSPRNHNAFYDQDHPGRTSHCERPRHQLRDDRNW
jgi:hypothetical protein